MPRTGRPKKQAGAPKQKYTRSSKRLPESTPTLKRYIKKEVDKQLNKKSDTKTNFVNYTNVEFNSTIDSVGDLYNIWPSIQAGTDDNQRVGRSITPMYTNVRGYVTGQINDTVYTTLGCLDVCLYCLASKTNQDGANRGLDDTYIIKRGMTKQQYDGTFASSCSPINIEDFHVLFKRNFRLIPIPTTSSAVASPPESFSLPNNSNSGSFVYKLKAKIDWQKMGFKKFDYDGSGALQPNNLNAFWCVGFAQYNNPSNAVNITYTPVRVTLQAISYYKDI